MRRTRSIALLMLAGVLTAGCNRSKDQAPAPPAKAPAPTSIPAPAQRVSVVGVTLGKALGADKKVTAAADTFAPGDTIYASIDTQGSASAQLSVRWTYEDNQLVREESMSIAPTGPATSEFHVSKPDGWPKGGYAVEILLDGVSVSRATFRVT